MKTFCIVLLFSALALPMRAQQKVVRAFSAQAFTKATSRTDTSGTITVGGYPVISVQTTTTGTDSAAMVTHVDALINSLWLLDALPAKGLTLGRPADTTLAGSAHTGQVLNWFLRDNGRLVDGLQNCSQIRLRNTLSAGAGDSTAATTYTQYVALRKVSGGY